MQLNEFNGIEPLIESLTQAILSTAESAIKERGYFSIALAGGSSPKKLYQALSLRTDFSNWVLLYGDERLYEKSHPERNEQLFLHCLSAQQIKTIKNQELGIKHYPMPFLPNNNAADSINTEQERQLYQNTVDAFLPIDCVLLGMGEDGHTASLFPKNLKNDIKQVHSVQFVNNSPKAPDERFTLSFNAINQSKAILLLATGDSKKPALHRFLNNDAQLPISHLNNNSLWVFTDINTQQLP